MYTIDALTGDLEADRGDYIDPKLTVTDFAGNPLDVSAATFKLTVKAALEDAIGGAIFQLTTGGGNFDVSGAATGIVIPLITESLTQGLSGDYVYDVEMVLSGKTTTIVKAALFRVLKDVTDVGSPPAPPSVLVPFPGDIQVIGGQIYTKDLGTGPYAGLWWKYVMRDGVFLPEGPSSVVPF